MRTSWTGAARTTGSSARRSTGPARPQWRTSPTETPTSSTAARTAFAIGPNSVASAGSGSTTNGLRGEKPTWVTGGFQTSSQTRWVTASQRYAKVTKRRSSRSSRRPVGNASTRWTKTTPPRPTVSWLSVHVSEVGNTHRTPAVATTRYASSSFHRGPAGSRR